MARYTLRPCAGSSSPITKWPCSNFEGAALHPLGVRRRKMTPDQKAQGLGRRDFLKTVAGATAAAAALLPQATGAAEAAAPAENPKPNRMIGIQAGAVSFF